MPTGHCNSTGLQQRCKRATRVEVRCNSRGANENRGANESCSRGANESFLRADGLQFALIEVCEVREPILRFSVVVGG